MKGLDNLKKKPRPVLVTMAKKLGIKVSNNWTRPTLAKKIIEKEKLKELDDHTDPNKSRVDVSQRNPELEKALAADGPPEPIEDQPESSQDDESGPGGAREGAGRTPGLTDEKARVERIMKNEVPDPVYMFFLKKFFSGWQRLAKDVPGIVLSDDEAKLVGVPTTNLMSYYFPNLKITPVLESWFGLYMSLELVIGSRLDLIKAARSGPEPDIEKPIIGIMEKLKGMPPDRIKQFAGMLGVKVGEAA